MVIVMGRLNLGVSKHILIVCVASGNVELFTNLIQL